MRKYWLRKNLHRIDNSSLDKMRCTPADRTKVETQGSSAQSRGLSDSMRETSYYGHLRNLRKYSKAFVHREDIQVAALRVAAGSRAFSSHNIYKSLGALCGAQGNERHPLLERGSNENQPLNSWGSIEYIPSSRPWQYLDRRGILCLRWRLRRSLQARERRG